MTVCVSSVTCYRFGKCGHIGKKEYTSGAATIRVQHTVTRHAEGLNTKMMQRKLLQDKTQRMNKALGLKSLITFHLTILSKWKFTNNRNSKADVKVDAPLELVSFV